MTLVSDIIYDAFRQSNLIAITTTPTDAQNAEALRYLQRVISSVYGNEAGELLQAMPIGRNNIQRPAGYPWYGTVPSNNWFVPKNIRVNLNITSSLTLYLDPAPNDGTRFGAVDNSKNLATFPVTIQGNGQQIDGQFSIVLNTNGFDGEWFYRADLGQWMKTTPLALTDTFPFPVEFDDFFITMLAMRLNPLVGASMDPQSQAVLTRANRQFQARYTQTVQMRSEYALIRLPNVAADRYYWGNEWQIYDSSSMFDKGWPG